MFLETPRFPDELAFGARGGSQYSTAVVGTYDGTETRNQNWSEPLARYEIGLVNRGRELTETLFAFFRTIAQGRTNGFRFRDPLPGEAGMTGGYLGDGDGVNTVFPLYKHYASGGIFASRRIRKPVPGTVEVFLDGAQVPGSTYLVDHAQGLVTIPGLGAGIHVTVSFEFDVPVRFDTDQLRMQRVRANLWSWESIILLETRAIL